MKKRPILFNAEMVNAILSGRKTQTRRIIKLDHERGMQNPVVRGKGGAVSYVGCRLAYTLCPLGEAGDRLWVRETFCPVNDDGEKWVDYRATPRYEQNHPAGWDCAPEDPEALKWKPSIHMPRWASRIMLEITGVRVERLNDISQEDAQAEGMELTGWRPTYSDPDSGGDVMTPYDNFAELWASIYGAESWQANPWVWVIEFKMVDQPHDQ